MKNFSSIEGLCSGSEMFFSCGYGLKDSLTGTVTAVARSAVSQVQSNEGFSTIDIMI